MITTQSNYSWSLSFCGGICDTTRNYLLTISLLASEIFECKAMLEINRNTLCAFSSCRSATVLSRGVRGASPQSIIFAQSKNEF